MRTALGRTLVLALLIVAAACTGASPEASSTLETSTIPAANPAASMSSQPSEAVAETTTTAADATTVTAPELGDLDGLGFDDFLEVSYELLLLRNPEFLTSLGVSDEYRFRNDRLNDLSPRYLEETQALEVGILDLLRAYDRSALSADEGVSFDVYEWFLDQKVRGHRFAYHDYPVHHFVNSFNFNLILFLSEEHLIETVGDAEDYISRLSQIDDQVAQVLERLSISEDAGVIPTRILVTWAIGALHDDLGGSRDPSADQVTRLPLYTTFAERLEAVEGIDESERASLLDRVEEELVGSFVPAWRALIDHLEQIESLASTDAGLWRLPDGTEYYEWLLRDHTSTDPTPDEVHQLGLDAVTRVQAELQTAFARLGYPEDASIGDLRQRSAEEAGFLSGSPGRGA